MESSRHTSQVRFLFHQVDLMSLVGYGQGAGHAGDASSHHQGRLVDRQIKFLQRLQMAGPGHRHADDILGLLGGLFLFFGVDPGAMLPDIGHIEEILIDARFPKGVPEQRFKGPGGAGGDHHPIEPFFLGQVRYFLGGIGGAGKQLFLGVDHIGQGQSVFDRGRNIDDLPILAPQWQTKTPTLGSSLETSLSGG